MIPIPFHEIAKSLIFLPLQGVQNLHMRHRRLTQNLIFPQGDGRMLRKAHSSLLLCGLAVLGLQSLASATIPYSLVTNDADSGISSSNTYTHAIDFNASGGGATINGVVFTAATGNTGNFTRTVANGSVNNHNGTGEVTTSGNLADLMQGFLYNSGPATDGSGLQTYTITGLTIGTTYDLRLYNHAWTAAGNRPNELVFDVGGANDSTGFINTDRATTVGMAGDNDSYYINYRYTASSTSLVFTAANQSGSNASFHLYGLTNQVVIPEPSSCLLSGLGGLLLLRRRRK